jgi:2'-5' RNA ligase
MEHLYFIAILPDNIIRDEVMEFKFVARDRFNSSKALNSPPHITIVPPFKCSYKEQKEILKSLKQILKSTKKIYITLNGFNRFDKRVIYIDVEKNKNLYDLKNKVMVSIVKIVPQIANDLERFKPHMTIAFRDLKKEVFPDAWNYFSKIDYYRIFKADNLTLLRHDGTKWQIV